MNLLGMKPKKPGPAPVAPTRDDARDAGARQDELRRRQGSVADMITGPTGAEAGGGGKVMLG